MCIWRRDAKNTVIFGQLSGGEMRNCLWNYGEASFLLCPKTPYCPAYRDVVSARSIYRRHAVFSWK
jgi:hypothetical protein